MFELIEKLSALNVMNATQANPRSLSSVKP